MRISKLRVISLVGLLSGLSFVLAPMTMVCATEPAPAPRVETGASEGALDEGLKAYRAGGWQSALLALTKAADDGLIAGRYHLARFYADPANPARDHARAYALFHAIVDEFAATIDVDDDVRAPYVGRSLTALARYSHRGLPDVGVKPSAETAASYLQEAATFFRESDAQFELAKLYLTGEGVRADPKTALNWLVVLTQQGHAGAQAFLADLYWRGHHVPKDEHRALALISVAVEHAPAHERIWVEDFYQNIFCGSSAALRHQSSGLIATFKKQYAPRAGIDEADRIADASPLPLRTCGNGEPLPALRERGENPSIPKSLDRKSSTRSSEGGVMGINAAPPVR